MSFLLEDIEAIQGLTKLSEQEITGNTQLETEYMKWLRFYHIDGGRGPLKGFYLISVLRMVGIDPPSAKRPEDAAGRVNWAEVEPMTKVVVTKTISSGGKVKEVKLLGDYFGMFDMGKLAIRFGSNPNVEEFPARQVSLAPSTLTADVKTSGDDFVATPADAKTEEELEAQYDKPEPAKALDPADATGRKRAPKMKDASWHTVEPATPVLAEIGGETVEARFVDVGPQDGQIQVCIPDPQYPTRVRELVVNESKAAVA
jgi:hypothetical protein